ncbi:MAG: hypothetical protein D6746_01505 [Bacteroidetes bacterium]|nr:MAG: hypothetical protein D6746_01505 [Bacteroidota bacterium]
MKSFSLVLSQVPDYVRRYRDAYEHADYYMVVQYHIEGTLIEVVRRSWDGQLHLVTEEGLKELINPENLLPYMDKPYDGEANGDYLIDNEYGVYTKMGDYAAYYSFQR